MIVRIVCVIQKRGLKGYDRACLGNRETRLAPDGEGLIIITHATSTDQTTKHFEMIQGR